jgi:tryptophan synthase alpha chain
VTVGAASRLSDAFARARSEERPALITYVIPGFPSVKETPAIFDAMVAGGADIVEVGIPFSDPLADGATIQRAAFQAIGNGTTVSSCLNFVREARGRHPDVPMVFMTYLNPVLAFGLDRFATGAASAGADAVIFVDLPPEEAAGPRADLERNGLDLVCLVAPTSSPERIEKIAGVASGFIYCVSVAGITGARGDLPPDLATFVGRVRRCTNLPLAVGFGMSRREHVQALTGIADGVVVASAIMDLIAAAAPEERAKTVREYVEVLSGRRRPLS